MWLDWLENSLISEGYGLILKGILFIIVIITIVFGFFTFVYKIENKIQGIIKGIFKK